MSDTEVHSQSTNEVEEVEEVEEVGPNEIDEVEDNETNEVEEEKVKEDEKVLTYAHTADTGTFRQIPLNQLVVSDNNVRKSGEDAKHDETNINTLTANISQYGLLNPLTVTPSETQPEKFEVLAGQRRLKALTRLEWKEAPCRILHCESQEQASLISLAENMQRLPMTIRDKCFTIQKLYNLHGEDLDAVVRLTNLSQTTIKRYLNLSDNLASSLHDQFDEKGENRLTLGVANLLSKAIPDPQEQEEVYEAIKDLATNKQKKEVLQALVDDPESDLQELVDEVKDKDSNRKRLIKIKKSPWTFDEKKEAVSIPKRMYPAVFQLINQSAGEPKQKRQRKRYKVSQP